MKYLETCEEHLNILEEYGIDLSDIVNPQRFFCSEGEVLCDDGEPIEFLYFLLEGTVKTLIPAIDKPGLLLGRYVNRGIFDETALFRDDGIAHYRAVCECETEAISLPFTANKDILLRQNSFLIKEASSLSASIDQAMNSFFFKKYPFEYMLCSYIAVKRTDAEWIADIDQVAEDLSVTPRYVARCLELLVNTGVLTPGEQGYVISDVLRFESLNKGLYKQRRKRIKLNAEKRTPAD